MEILGKYQLATRHRVASLLVILQQKHSLMFLLSQSQAIPYNSIQEKVVRSKEGTISE